MLPLSRAPPACGVLVSWLSPHKLSWYTPVALRPPYQCTAWGPSRLHGGRRRTTAAGYLSEDATANVCVWVAASSWGLCRGLNWQCESVS